ncbi:MAG: adenylosuccinate lyase [Cyclobacteriaceae bacterium]|nr:adenylosuccinate lyase [Cyclobacteriaceae bacterium]
MNPLQAVSPIDGRYSNQTSTLSPYFSELGLIKYRVQVEVEYFIALCEMPLPQLVNFDSSKFEALRKLYAGFSEADAQRIKDTEKITNHDVKAVEYFIKEEFDKLGLEEFKEFIHFGLTSQDINNTAIPLSLKEGISDIITPLINKVDGLIYNMVKLWNEIPMLAKTHGQPASPTLLGKEMAVFHARINGQLEVLEEIPYGAKFGGATGNMNAHHVAYPNEDWDQFADEFVFETLGLSRSYPTTQIEHYDHLAELFDCFKRINTILIDFSRDIWQYISMGYFKQKIKAGEIGSSAMPHKVNPIDFENAEGNLGMANAILEHLSAKLPISRLQRDLTDSTVLRNVGVPLGHMIIALNSLVKGINKLELNQTAINADLEDNWAVVAEGIQNILRREGFPKPYEALKDLTRKNDKITESSISDFIDGLNISDEIKKELKQITPFNYVGKY